MFRISLALALVMLFAAVSGATARSLRSVSADRGGLAAGVINPDTIAVSGLGVTPRADGAIFLAWDAALRHAHDGGLRLTGYLIYSGDAPDHLSPLTMVSSNRYLITHSSAHAFFAVQAIYAGLDQNQRTLRDVRRDARVLLDFEQGNVDLQPYSQQEDVNPNGWSVTNEEAYPPSDRSLELSGNTWKRLAFGRQILTDTTVWSIAILSIDGDTSARVQGFGVGDGVRELFYTFTGRETFWQQAWLIANQESRPRGQWSVWKLNIGYDWKIRYGYLPSIDQLLFVNDNDDNNPSAHIYFDQLTDITADIPEEPHPKARWNIDPTVEGNGTAVRFLATVDNREREELTLNWDFGDGQFGVGFYPLHFFAQQGVYRVGLEARGQEGLIGRTSLTVEAGELRFPQSVLCAFTGDVMLARRYEQAGGLINVRGPEAVFERIRQQTTSADIFAVNLECPLTNQGSPHPSKDYVFRGSPANVAGLTSAGVDVTWQANNHVSDYGKAGLVQTIQVLDAAHIAHCGAGVNEYEALKPIFKSVNGVRIGFLSFCNRTGRDANDRPYLDAGYDKDGYAYYSADNILRSVPDAAELCDVLVLAVHGGQEYDLAPLSVGGDELYPSWSDERITFSARVDSATRQLDHMAIELGAGLIISHHPHVQQGYEVYNGVIIAHSLGNFAFDQDFFETWPSAMVWAEIGSDGVHRLEIEPVFVDNYQPTPAIGNLGAKILERLAGYSQPLNATVIPDYERMRATVVANPETITRDYSDREATGTMRWIERDGVYRSEPIYIGGMGFPAEISALAPDGQDAGWQVRLGRDVLLVGNMESEGASIWNYNSNYEGRDSAIVHGGRYSSFLRRNAGQADAVTDLIQRIPLLANDNLTLAGWARITNGRDAALAARWYRYRNDNQPQNIYGDSTAGPRLQGTHDWQRIWGDLTVPDNAAFVNIRWQNYGAQNGSGMFWVDDVDLIRWDGWTDYESRQQVDYPSDICYLQIQTRRPLEQVTVRFRTVTLGVQ